MEKDLIEVRLSAKCTLFLTRSEMVKLLSHDSGIHRAAIERGKGILRRRKQSDRERTKWESEGGRASSSIEDV